MLLGKMKGMIIEYKDNSYDVRYYHDKKWL